MNPTELEPLSEEVQQLLAKERDYPPESNGLRKRALARALAARQGFHVARHGFHALHASPRRTRPVWLLAAALCAFGAISFAAWRSLHPVETPPAVSSVENKPPEAPLVNPTSPTPETEASEPTGSTSEALPKESESIASPSRSASVGDTYPRELSVLQRARVAVANGEFSVALAAVGEHQRRFPSGKLQEEREALRIRALSGLGRKEEARRAAARFSERFPGSVLSPRLSETAR